MRSLVRIRIGPSHLVLLLLLGTALAVRLWQVDLTEFDSDQTALLSNAQAFLDSGQVPQTGGLLFTVGIRHPPLVTFIYSVPMLISRDPVWISSFQAVVDALTVVFLYLIGTELVGRWAGFAMGWVYASCPPWCAVLAVGRYDSSSLARLPVQDGAGNPIGDRFLAPVRPPSVPC